MGKPLSDIDCSSIIRYRARPGCGSRTIYGFVSWRPPAPRKASFFYELRLLLRRACAGGRRHAVLLAGAAGCADRADDLAVHDDRKPAFGCHRLLRKGRERGI